MNSFIWSKHCWVLVVIPLVLSEVVTQKGYKVSKRNIKGYVNDVNGNIKANNRMKHHIQKRKFTPL